MQVERIDLRAGEWNVRWYGDSSRAIGERKLEVVVAQRQFCAVLVELSVRHFLNEVHRVGCAIDDHIMGRGRTSRRVEDAIEESGAGSSSNRANRSWRLWE